MMNSRKTWKQSTKNSNAASTESAQDKALNRFAELMIEKIESISSDWKKPWFTEGSMQWPRNLNGRNYNGMNSLMLTLHCEQMGYKYPIFCTFDRVNALNFSRTNEGLKPLVDDKGEKLPIITVRKGEKSFPVFLTLFKCVDEKGNKIPYDDYKNMSDSEKKDIKVYPSQHVYYVFNIDQTNMKECRPELYDKLIADMVVEKPVKADDNMHFEPVDRMIEDNLWICPITPKYGDRAYYSPSKKIIVIPEFKQFKTGESFYSNLFHEMAHSTGAEEHLNRLKPAAFGSSEYAKEELVAELTAAMVAQYYGMDKFINEDSAAYLKSWLKSLKEDADFIKTVLMDVKKAAAMLTFKIDEIKNLVKSDAA